MLTFPSNEQKSMDLFLNTFQQLNSCTLSTTQAWDTWILLLEWNQANPYFQPQQLQKLWMKLIKKYKFKFTYWESANIPSNFHAFVIDETGDGLRNLLRFYQDRNLFQWKIHAFEYGIEKLFHQYQFNHLEMYFLTQIICEEWAKKYQLNKAFKIYYANPKYPKTKALYNAFLEYQQKKNSGAQLYNLLSAYNPQYNLVARNTPKFYKNLYHELHTILV